MKRVKTWDDNNKSRGGWSSNSERLEKKEHLYYEEKKQIQMHKKGRKKNEVMSNILYVIKTNICLYVYIFITNKS